MKSCKRVLSLFISFCLLISVSVLAAPVTQKPENVPQTGDDATVTLYVVTLAASLALLGGAVVVNRRRQR